MFRHVSQATQLCKYVSCYCPAFRGWSTMFSSLGRPLANVIRANSMAKVLIFVFLVGSPIVFISVQSGLIFSRVVWIWIRMLSRSIPSYTMICYNDQHIVPKDTNAFEILRIGRYNFNKLLLLTDSVISNRRSQTVNVAWNIDLIFANYQPVSYYHDSVHVHYCRPTMDWFKV